MINKPKWLWITMTKEEAQDWYERVAAAISENGTNDEEHDLLIEMSDLVGTALNARIEWDDEGNTRVVEGRYEL